MNQFLPVTKRWNFQVFVGFKISRERIYQKIQPKKLPKIHQKFTKKSQPVIYILKKVVSNETEIIQINSS